METTLTQEQLHQLKISLDFDIKNYLIVNSIQWLDGGKKADIHMNISKTICRHIFDVQSHDYANYKVNGSWVAIHDHLADILTDRMDEVIGFPVFEPIYDIDLYKERFFNVIIENIDEMRKIANENLKM